MLRYFGLLVVISIALLLWAVRPSGSRSLTQGEAVPARAAPPSSAATEPRWSDRPVPRIADVSPVNEWTEAATEAAYVPTAADEALVARAIDFLDQFTSVIESNAGNCDRMAGSLSELLSSSRDLIAEGKAMADQPTRSRWFEGRMVARMTAWTERIMTPLQSCMSNERVMAALTSLAR